MSDAPKSLLEDRFSGKALIRLILPLIVEQFLAVLVGMADTLMVAGVDEFSMSAVSTVDTINVLLIQLFSAMGAGGAVVAAQYLGHNDRKNACGAAKQLLLSTLAVSSAIAAIALIGNKWILTACFPALDPGILAQGETYFMLSALSYPLLGLYNGGVGILRAQGDSKSSMWSSIVMNVINIGGNALLIHPLGMGVAGAGLASLLSRGVSAVIIVRILLNQNALIHIDQPRKPEWDGVMVKRILRIGIPNGAENSLFQVGKLLIMGIITTLPVSMISANAAVNSLSGIPNIPGAAVGLASITVIGQCVGAGDEKQARRYGMKMLRLMYLAVLPFNLLIMLLAPVLLQYFNLPPEGLTAAIELQRIYCLLSIFTWVPSFGLPNILRAAGDARFTMAVSMVSMLVLRLGLSYVLVYALNMGLLGVWLAMHADWVMRGALFIWRFAGKKWLRNRVI